MKVGDLIKKCDNVYADDFIRLMDKCGREVFHGTLFELCRSNPICPDSTGLMQKTVESFFMEIEEHTTLTIYLRGFRLK